MVKGIVNYNKAYELNREITGVIHKDRIWEQWYDQKVFNEELPKMNQTDYLFSCNKDYPNQNIINNRGMKRITVSDFKEMVDTFAKALRVYGIGYKDVVATVALSTPELLALKYACAKIGAITANLAFADAVGAKENNKMYKQLKLINPAMIFVLDILENNVSDLLNDPEFKSVDKVILPLDRSTPILNVERAKIALLNVSNQLKNKNINNAIKYKEFLNKAKECDLQFDSVYQEKLACNIAFTSGTTGINKAVLLSHDANNALAFQHKLANLGLERAETNLALVPPFLAFWDADIIHMAMCLGIENILELALTYENIPIYLKKHLPNYGIWSQYLWDSVLHMDKNDREEVLKNLKKVVIGGERADVNQIETFAKITGIAQEAGYGATEMDSCFSVAHPNCNIYGSAGIPLPFNNVKILGEGGNLLTYNEPGRIYLTGPGMMNCYFNRDDLTKEVLITDSEGVTWYDTKDYGFVDKTGSLVVIDRDKPPVEICNQMIKLADISEMIKEYPYIKICKTDVNNNSIVTHVVFDEFSEVSQDILISGLIQFIAENIPINYQPNILNIMDSLPRTPVGKVDYPKLQNITDELIASGKYQENSKLNINTYEEQSVRVRK